MVGFLSTDFFSNNRFSLCVPLSRLLALFISFNRTTNKNL